MGLAEDIKDALRVRAEAEAAAKAIAEKTLQEAREAAQMALGSETQAIQAIQQAELDRKAAIITKLTPLLEVVGAREQLEEVRKVWTVGKIDQSPTVFYSTSGHDMFRHRYEKRDPFIGLALRYSYWDLHSESIPGCWMDGDNPQTYSVRAREVALRVLVGIESESNNGPYVTSVHGTILTAQIFSDDPLRSKDILRDQLFKISTSSKWSPLDQEKRARDRILTSDLPDEVKYRHFPELRPPLLPWYRKILG